MARNTPWHADGEGFNRLRFEKDGMSFDVQFCDVVDTSRAPSPGQRGEWKVDVDGVEVGRAPAHADDWERSVYDLAIAVWKRKGGARG